MPYHMGLIFIIIWMITFQLGVEIQNSKDRFAIKHKCGSFIGFYTVVQTLTSVFRAGLKDIQHFFLLQRNDFSFTFRL